MTAIPTLVRELSDSQLRALSEAGSFARVRGYFASNRVLELDDRGWTALPRRARALFDRVVESDGALTGALTADDIRDLIAP